MNDSKLPSLGISSSTAIFDGSGTNRVPLAVTFKQSANNEKFTVVVTHFKSKGSAGAAGTLDNDANDGAGFSNQTRLNGVTALEKWLATDPTNSNDTDFILLGDFNECRENEGKPPPPRCEQWRILLFQSLLLLWEIAMEQEIMQCAEKHTILD